jgi:glycosyltransferase involved in cell wall biosynthesis
MRVCILANSARYIWNFRTNLMLALQARGYDVLAMSPAGEEVSLLAGMGFRHVALPLAPKSTHVAKEINTIRALRTLLRGESVDVVLSSTPKGNLYTALANRGTPRRQIANVSGMGSAYLRRDWLTRIVEFLYSSTFDKITHVLFENPTDHSEFLRRGWVRPKNASLIPGLGVDLNHFTPYPWPAEDGTIRFLMISRLIGDKGVREYAAAARQVRSLWPQARFDLLGDSGADNPSRIESDELLRWTSAGDIVHHEHTGDVRPYLAQAHCVVLPSYREGMSRTLLEGGAMGRPLIASDVPGCREAVDVGMNGFLCEARSDTSLTEALLTFLRLTSEQQQQMGAASRQKIATGFGEEVVIQRYVSLLAEMR